MLKIVTAAFRTRLDWSITFSRDLIWRWSCLISLSRTSKRAPWRASPVTHRDLNIAHRRLRYGKANRLDCSGALSWVLIAFANNVFAAATSRARSRAGSQRLFPARLRHQHCRDPPNKLELDSEFTFSVGTQFPHHRPLPAWLLLATAIYADVSTHVPIWQWAIFIVPVCGTVSHNVGLSGSGTPSE